MKKVFGYLFIFFGIFKFSESSVSTSFVTYTQVVDLISNIIENNDLKSLENFKKYSEPDVNFIEEKIQNLAIKKLKLTAGLLIADYYINKEYKRDSSIDSLCNDNIKKAADYISDFMIEYMDYDNINKYINIQLPQRTESFGDYMKSVKASVVLKDIEGAITAYYFPKLKTDETLPSPKPRDPKVKNLQTSRSASEQIEQDHGLKRKADQANLAKNSGEIESNIENKLEQKQTWGGWFYSWGEWLLGK